MTYVYSLLSAFALLLAFGSCATPVEIERFVNTASLGRITSTRVDSYAVRVNKENYASCSVYLTVYEKGATIQQEVNKCKANTALLVHGKYQDKTVKPGEIYVFNKASTVTYDFIVSTDIDKDGRNESFVLSDNRQIWP